MERLRLLIRLALRNVRRQTRRSLLTAAAMIVSLMLLIFSRSISDGAHETWIEAAVRLGPGHIAVQAPEFRARRAIEAHLAGPELGAVTAARADQAVAPEIAAATGRLEVAALASSPASALPVAVIGVDPGQEVRFSEMDRRVVQGRYLEAGDRLQAFVGTELAGRLHLEIGDRFVLTAQALDSSISEQLVRVVGTFRTGVPEVDQSLVQIPLATAQEWLGVGDGVTTVALLLVDSWAVERVAKRLRRLLSASADRIAVLSWRQAVPELDAAIRIDDAGDWIFHGILFLIVALTIVNTVLMSVLYRTREFGVVRALGLRRRDSAFLVILEAMVLTLASGVVGVILGLALTWGLFRNGLDFTQFMGDQFTAAGAVIDPVFVPTFRVAQLLSSLAFILVIGILASLYPAWRATRVDITEAMKFEG